MERLGEIHVPALVTCGRNDECTPEMSSETAGAILIVFEETAHFAQAEEPERYRKVVAQFLERVEAI